MKWQENNIFKEGKFNIKNIKLEYVDYKSTIPYLRINIIEENKNFNIKQEVDDDWSIGVMKDIIKKIGNSTDYNNNTD